MLAPNDLKIGLWCKLARREKNKKGQFKKGKLGGATATTPEI
jgi:hypothetical protein